MRINVLTYGMNSKYHSCLVSRLSRFVTLTDRECAFIANLEKEERPRKKGRPIVSVGEQTEGLMVMKSGWAVVKADSTDGRSQILRTYLPGEVVGMAELGTAHSSHRIVMQTDGVVCPFPRNGLAPMFTDYPRLAALLISIASLDQIALRYHATCLGSMAATDKLKFFLLQLRSRLAVANVGLGNHFQVPFSQVEIGQSVGLTSIYVNKLLRGFAATGEIEVTRPYVRLLAREKWEKDVGFIDAFRSIDTSWFPPAE